MINCQVTHLFLCLQMTSDLSHLTSVFPLVVESIFMSSSLVVILIDWNHSCLETSLLRVLQSSLPRWRNHNIRQKTYLCLFGISLALMYTNSMINFSINMENFRIAITSMVVLLSFWFQSKTNSNTLSNQLTELPKVQVSHKSVGGSPVTLRDQGTSASICCGARIPQYPLSMPASSVPQSEVNIEEEMKEPYVLAYRSHFDLEEVSVEKLTTAIRYLNTLRGGKSYLVQIVIQLICQIYRHIICYLSELQNYQCLQNKYCLSKKKKELCEENTVTNYLTYIYFICVIQNMYNLTQKPLLNITNTFLGYH